MQSPWEASCHRSGQARVLRPSPALTVGPRECSGPVVSLPLDGSGFGLSSFLFAFICREKALFGSGFVSM